LRIKEFPPQPLLLALFFRSNDPERVIPALRFGRKRFVFRPGHYKGIYLPLDGIEPASLTILRILDLSSVPGDFPREIAFSESTVAPDLSRPFLGTLERFFRCPFVIWKQRGIHHGPD